MYMLQSYAIHEIYAPNRGYQFIDALFDTYKTRMFIDIVKITKVQEYFRHLREILSQH